MDKKELLAQINAKKKEVIDLACQERLEEAAKAKEELKALQAKYDLIEDLDEENVKNFGNPGNGRPAGGMDSVAEFAAAARKGFKVADSLASGMREGSDEDGGYTVPEDIQTKVNQWKQAEASLESLISVENVTAIKGQRTYEKKADMTGFADLEEEGEKLQEMDTPKFERIRYAIQNRGGWLPLSNDLLSDTDANITEVITRWIARKSNATSNYKILGLVNTKEAKEIETLEEVNREIIVTLGATYRDAATILTNDDGLLFLSLLKDNNGRPLLQPDPMDVMKMFLSVGPVKVPLRSVPNAVMKSDDSVTGKVKIPFIPADFKEAFKKYDRQKTSLLSSNVAAAGNLNAFTQNLTLVRAIERNDFRVVDADAFVNLNIVVDTSQVQAAGK